MNILRLFNQVWVKCYFIPLNQNRKPIIEWHKIKDAKIAIMVWNRNQETPVPQLGFTSGFITHKKQQEKYFVFGVPPLYYKTTAPEPFNFENNR